MSEMAEARIRELEGKLDIIRRYTEGEGITDDDYALLANDYGGLGWEQDPVVEAVHKRMKRLHEWEENVKYLVDSYPNSIRSRYKGGPENLLESLVITFIGLRDGISPIMKAKPGSYAESFQQERKS